MGQQAPVEIRPTDAGQSRDACDRSIGRQGETFWCGLPCYFSMPLGSCPRLHVSVHGIHKRGLCVTVSPEAGCSSSAGRCLPMQASAYNIWVLLVLHVRVTAGCICSMWCQISEK